MTMTFQMHNLNVEESPASISYVLLSLFLNMYEFEFRMADDGYNDYLEIVDDGLVMARVEVTPVMGELLISVLRTTTQEVAHGCHGV